MDSPSHIRLQGVATNNLKNINVDVPLGLLTVVTGVSGSGKSSLVFDTLYTESYRRYVESLSSFARQYLKALPKPKIEHIEQLPPAIAVQQSRSGANARSTVGTITEIIDLIRVMYTHLAQIHCYQCGDIVQKHSPEHIARWCVQEHAGKYVTLTAPASAWGSMKVETLKAQLRAQGFGRLWKNNAAIDLDGVPAKQFLAEEIYIDRIIADDDEFSRLAEGAQNALRMGRGLIRVNVEGGTTRLFNSELICPQCKITYREPTTALLSFNHPMGACKTCQGFGAEGQIDWIKVFPDLSSSLAERGVAPWNFGSHDEMYAEAIQSAKKNKIDLKKPFSNYDEHEWDWLKKGSGKDFDGVVGYFKWLDGHKHKPHYRIHAARFRTYVTCSECKGSRLNSFALACRMNGKSIAEAAQLEIPNLKEWLAATWHLAQERGKLIDAVAERQGIMGVREAFEDASARLSYLLKMGLKYLTLDRQTRTLSGGELQRIRMARCLGSALTDTLYCLDEPTSGLHARDSANLLEVLYELRDQGNTVVVVEHERQIIAGADHRIEIGPKAGHEGGYLMDAQASLAAASVKGARERWKPKTSMQPTDDCIVLKGACTHNLKNITVRIPIGKMTVVCGVSGSGKTSLIQHTLYPMLAQEIMGESPDGHVVPQAAAVGPKPILKKFSQVMSVSQAVIGRSTRSNIATYLGMFDEVRRLFAAQPDARALKLTPSHFSFNSPGGRCENCRGLGVVVEDLSFLGDMAVTCPSCDGKRFDDEVLSVKYRDKNLLEVLDLTAAQAREFFFDQNSIRKALDAVIDIGLGYVTLGQSTSSFSGGEAQRLKLIKLLHEDGDGSRPSILIFDEPTTGLSDTDVERLITELRKLTVRGHTVIVVEHHIGMILSADWVIEIGPEAAHEGGELVFEGPSKDLESTPRSVTASYLRSGDH